MVNKIRLYWTNYKTKRRTTHLLPCIRQSNISLSAVSDSTSQTRNERFLLCHSVYLTFLGTRKAASLAVFEVGEPRIQLKRRDPSASSLPPHKLGLDATTVDPIIGFS